MPVGEAHVGTETFHIRKEALVFLLIDLSSSPDPSLAVARPSCPSPRSEGRLVDPAVFDATAVPHTFAWP